MMLATLLPVRRARWRETQEQAAGDVERAEAADSRVLAMVRGTGTPAIRIFLLYRTRMAAPLWAVAVSTAKLVAAQGRAVVELSLVVALAQVGWQVGWVLAEPAAVAMPVLARAALPEWGPAEQAAEATPVPALARLEWEPVVAAAVTQVLVRATLVAMVRR